MTSMIDALKPYPANRDSGVEWLARISHTSRLAVVGRATWLAVASGGAIMRRNIGPS